MKYTQLVLVEFNNAGPWVTRFTSDAPITIEQVAKYYTDEEGFDEERDGITFLSEPEEVQLTSV